MILSRKDSLRVMDILEATYPFAKAELDFTNPLELLVATILSAQCTDVRVNKTTPTLFQKYKTAKEYAEANLDELMEMIRPCGFYRTKANHLIGAGRVMVESFHGEVPRTMEEIMTLPGVGRKTANVVLSNAYGVPGIAVDTHVFRVSNRIGLCDTDTPEKTEAALQKILPKDRWSKSHHLLIFHGRRCCAARKPQCTVCPVSEYCLTWRKKQNEKQ